MLPDPEDLFLSGLCMATLWLQTLKEPFDWKPPDKPQDDAVVQARPWLFFYRGGPFSPNWFAILQP